MATAPVSPLTATGVLRCVVVPSPIWPLALEPQHLAVPSVSRAQLNAPPSAVRGSVEAPQKSVPPQPSAMVPVVAACAAHVVGTHPLQVRDVPTPHGKPTAVTALGDWIVVWLPRPPYWLSP